MNTSANNPSPKLRLKKGETLSSKKDISELFEKGSFFYLKPFRVYFQFDRLDKEINPQVLFSVPKAKHPKAAHRNRIKRMMREAYRTSKPLLLDHLSNSGINLKKIGLVYIEDEVFSFSDLKIGMNEIPSRIVGFSKKLK